MNTQQQVLVCPSCLVEPQPSYIYLCYHRQCSSFWDVLIGLTNLPGLTSFLANLTGLQTGLGSEAYGPYSEAYRPGRAHKLMSQAQRLTHWVGLRGFWAGLLGLQAGPCSEAFEA